MGERAISTTKKPEAKQTCSNSCKQNTGLNSPRSTADMILQLQITAGNQAVQRLIKSGALQARLTTGQPDDKYEQEVERVAENVVRMPDPVIQRKCSKCEDDNEKVLQTKEIFEKSHTTPSVASITKSTSEFRSLDITKLSDFDLEQEYNKIQKRLLSSTPYKERSDDEAYLKTIEAEISKRQYDDFVTKTIESFQDPILKDQIGSNINNRRDFLLGMQQYLGPLEKVIEHFKAIREVRAPGVVHLHERAASRLEMISSKLGDNMPSTTVALGLRGRYSPHKRNSKGLMAHPLGYAIDYRPISNSQITDPRLVKLIQMQIGGSISFELGMDHRKRRELLSKIGSQTAGGGIDPESDLGKQAATFFEHFEAEYKRLSEASKKFTDELPEQLTEAKKALQGSRETNNQLKAIEKKLNKLKKLKKTDKVKNSIAESEAEKQILIENKQKWEAKLTNLKSDLPALFKPWLDKIKTEMDVAEKSAIGVDLKTLEIPAKKEATKARWKAVSESKKLLRDKLKTEKSIILLECKIKETQTKALKSEKSKLAFYEKLTVWNNEIIKLRSLLEKQNEQLAAIKSKLDEMDSLEELRPIKGEWDTLKNLEKALSGDERFVFTGERAEKNPSVMQLIESGFFTPDPELEEGKKLNGNKHGFNLAFMKLMAEHGFEQGTNWRPGSTDPMHFELVEAVDSVPMGP